MISPPSRGAATGPRRSSRRSIRPPRPAAASRSCLDRALSRYISSRLWQRLSCSFFFSFSGGGGGRGLPEARQGGARRVGRTRFEHEGTTRKRPERTPPPELKMRKRISAGRPREKRKPFRRERRGKGKRTKRQKEGRKGLFGTAGLVRANRRRIFYVPLSAPLSRAEGQGVPSFFSFFQRIQGCPQRGSGAGP
jgi:hypothetical protein